MIFLNAEIHLNTEEITKVKFWKFLRFMAFKIIETIANISKLQGPENWNQIEFFNLWTKIVIPL